MWLTASSSGGECVNSGRQLTGSRQNEADGRNTKLGSGKVLSGWLLVAVEMIAHRWPLGGLLATPPRLHRGGLHLPRLPRPRCACLSNSSHCIKSGAYLLNWRQAEIVMFYPRLQLWQTGWTGQGRWMSWNRLHLKDNWWNANSHKVCKTGFDEDEHLDINFVLHIFWTEINLRFWSCQGPSVAQDLAALWRKLNSKQFLDTISHAN